MPELALSHREADRGSGDQWLETMAVIGSLARAGGGLTYSVSALVNCLAGMGIQRHMVSVRTPRDDLSTMVNEEIVRLQWVRSLTAQGFGAAWAPKLGSVLAATIREHGVRLVHTHGVWLPANHAAAAVSRRLGIPYIISPRGMLTVWAFNHKPLKKRLAWWLYMRRDIEKAAAIHMTADAEADEFEQLGFSGTLAVIPNGVDIPEWIERSEREDEVKTALFVSRFHPKKGLLNLVEAWARVRPRGWRMRLVGPDEDRHRAQVQEAVRRHCLEDVFTFDAPVYRPYLWDIYRGADLFILPTLSENFGNVVPESLACGVPVICTQGAPWAELNSERCGWWIAIGVDPLAAAIREATQTSRRERNEMGQRGRRLVERKYGWPLVGEQMRRLYGWIAEGGRAPDFVRVIRPR